MDSSFLFIFSVDILTSDDKRGCLTMEAAAALGTFFRCHHFTENIAVVQPIHEMLRHRTGEEHGEHGPEPDSSDSFQEQQREDNAQPDANGVESSLHLFHGEPEMLGHLANEQVERKGWQTTIQHQANPKRQHEKSGEKEDDPQRDICNDARKKQFEEIQQVAEQQRQYNRKDISQKLPCDQGHHQHENYLEIKVPAADRHVRKHFVQHHRHGRDRRHP